MFGFKKLANFVPAITYPTSAFHASSDNGHTDMQVFDAGDGIK